MQRHEIRLLQELLDAVRPLHAGGKPPRGIDGDLGIETDDLHAELDRHVGDQAADRAQADDPERTMRQLDARELLLAVLDMALEIWRRRVEAADVGKGGNDVARSDQQRRQHELLDGVRVRARRVEHRDAALRKAATGMLFVPAPARPIALTDAGIAISCISCERTRIASGASTVLPTA